LHAGDELDRLAGAVDRTAERLSMALAAEHAAEAARQDLFTAVSHDLRAPLGAVRAIVEAVDDGVVADQASLKRYMHDLRRSVDVLVELVDNLFELAQLDAGQILADRSAARLGDVVDAAVRAAAAQAAQQEVELDISVNGAAAERCSPRLVRVLHNLLQNAIRHAPAGSTVTVEVRRSGERLELMVRDAGEGIAAEHVQRLFEPFFRVDPARHGPGAGLGLALAERIVTNLGGAVGVESAPGQGATFVVDVPAAARAGAGKDLATPPL
jgi:signal transduction histidine kinase